MKAAWQFIAGDSPYCPAAIACALAFAALAKHFGAVNAGAEVAYVAILLAGLGLGTFDSK